jgi:RND family efflux transporter MFP subunit
MKNYRTEFVVTLVVNFILVGVVASMWLHSGRSLPGSDGGPEARSGPPPAAMPMPSSATAEQGETPPRAPMQLSAQRLQSIGVKTGEVERKSVADEIRTTGNVVVDETRLAYVQVRSSGYIQKVFVDATYRYVRKGQPLFTIYSPELVTAEHEYLLAKQSQQRMAQSTDLSVVADTASLVDAAATRLKQWDVPAREIARLESTGQARQDLEIDSPVSGYVIEREALPNKYAQPDTRLYTVADLSSIWVFAQVFQNDLGRLKVGAPATLTVDTYPGRSFVGQVDFIYPDIDMSTRTARVRLVFPNPDLKLTPGMFVNVALAIPMGEQLVIPAAGVLQSGTRAVAFVDRGAGSLEPREIEIGAPVADDFIVLKGLRAGEKVVTSANFLIDSESQLQAALGTFVPPPAGAGTTGAPATPQANLEVITEPNPPQKGNNLFRVRVTGAGGAPIPQADVTVTFFMAAMPAMGMAAMRVPVSLSDKGGGLYEGPGQLDSGGTWQVTIVAKKNGQVVATKQLSVRASGGM